jgi:FkbM family methyltransferase
MSLKSLILDFIEHPVLGALVRLIGGLTRRRARLFGLSNPFHVPAWTIEHGGARYWAEPRSYLARGSPASTRVRFDPDRYEAEIEYLIETLVGPGDVVLDIGANVGLHTVALARRVGAQGRVYAFEPVTEMAERLSANVALNGLANVTLVGCALGNVEGTATMQVNVAGAGLEGTSSLADSIHVRRHPERYVERDVEVRRLDDVMARMDPASPIGFVKIDTEGFETMVIEGGMETLDRDRPAMIVEAHSTRLAQAGKSFRWYSDTFPDHHIFIVHAVNRANPYLRLEPLSAEPPEIAVNLLLLPKVRAWTPET